MSQGPTFLNSTAVAGVGYTALTKDSQRSVLSLAREACLGALDDCGLDRSQVDGIVSFSLFGDSVPCQAVATSLGLDDLTYAIDLNLGGQAPCFAVALAGMAISTNMASSVLVYRALNGRSGTRIGSTRFESPSARYRYPIGFSAYPYYIAMWARRYMIETGATWEDLAAVVVSQSQYAALNPRAFKRSPIELADYVSSPLVAEPFRAADCTSEVDGACALLVTSLESARALRWPPAVLTGAAWTTPRGAGLDIADIHGWRDYTRTCHAHLASRLWESSGLGPTDVAFAELYDCFSSVPLLALEDLGFVGRGEAGAFVRSGETGIDGSLPVNTHGGLLCEGYLHGLNTVTEAVLQIQGRCGDRQVRQAHACAVTSGAMMDGSALILAADT